MINIHHLMSAGLAPARSGPRVAWPDIDDEPAPESGVGRRRVLVTLYRNGPLQGAIQMGRLIADAIGAPLHGLFLAPAPIEAVEVPDLVGVAPEALHGLVLDVIADGDPGEALATALSSQAAAYVVVASAHGSVDERLGLSAIARRVIDLACCGVVVLGPQASAPRLRRMLLPLDGTPSTASAIGPAGELARNVGAELDIVLVGEAGPQPGRVPYAPPAVELEPGAMAPRYVDQPHHEWAAFTEEFLHRFAFAIGHFPPDVDTRFFLGRGLPAEEILRFAHELESDLLVLVWHGEVSDEHGAVFREVMRRTPCPVLVLRR